MLVNHKRVARFNGTRVPMSGDAPANGTIGPSFHVSVGTIALNRNFAASGRASIDNPLTGGIEYRLGFVPGFSLNGAVAPFKRRGVGFAMGYERVFFRTKQRTQPSSRRRETAK